MGDIIASIIYIGSIVLAAIVFVSGISAGSVFMILVMPLIIILGGLLLGNSFMSDEAKQLEREEEQKKQYKKMHGGYKCPNCGAMAGHPIGMLSKKWSIDIMGAASNKFGKTYKCENCGYMW